MNYIKLKIQFFIFFALAINISVSQPRIKISSLKVGDSMPNISLGPIVNYAASSIKYSDIKKKLLILDFWGSWCIPCVKAIPVYEQLQRQFNDSLRILLVATQGRNIISSFLSNKNISLPSIVNDTLLSKYLFPHNYVPHEVWIKDGKVFAITSESEVTHENIQSVLSGRIKSFPEKKSNFEYDINLPLLVDGNGGGAQDLLFHSVFTGYIDGIGGGGVSVDSSNRFKIRALNGCVLDLYQSAFRYAGNVALTYNNRKIIDVPFKEKLLRPSNPAYYASARDNFYCYELIVPLCLKVKAPAMMLDDLNHFFGSIYNIHGKVEKREVKCWVLKKKGSISRLRSKSITSNTFMENDSIMVYCKQPFEIFFTALQYRFRNQSIPIINQTGTNINIDIKFPTNEMSISAIRQFLKKYNLYLEQKECKIDMLVINENI